MKNSDLQAALAKLPPDLDVLVWLPGSRIVLSGPCVGRKDVSRPGDKETEGFEMAVLIEGNVVAGSALDDVTPRVAADTAKVLDVIEDGGSQVCDPKRILRKLTEAGLLVVEAGP